MPASVSSAAAAALREVEAGAPKPVSEIAKKGGKLPGVQRSAFFIEAGKHASDKKLNKIWGAAKQSDMFLREAAFDGALTRWRPFVESPLALSNPALKKKPTVIKNKGLASLISKCAAKLSDGEVVVDLPEADFLALNVPELTSEARRQSGATCFTLEGSGGVVWEAVPKYNRTRSLVPLQKVKVAVSGATMAYRADVESNAAAVRESVEEEVKFAPWAPGISPAGANALSHSLEAILKTCFELGGAIHQTTGRKRMSASTAVAGFKAFDAQNATARSVFARAVATPIEKRKKKKRGGAGAGAGAATKAANAD